MHEKMLWFNDDIQYRFHDHIMEYDMKAASVSACEYYHLLDEDKIRWLKLLPKNKREVQMGLMQKDKEFSDKLLSSIREIRRKFLENNHLDSSNIIALHSDACIITTTKNIDRFVDTVEFRCKGKWTAFIRYQKIEIFYSDGVVTYKGIPDEILKSHTMGLNQYFLKVFDKIENYDTSILRYLSRFQRDYLQDKLPDYYYIPFGNRGNYKMENLKLLSYIANIVLNEMRGW